MLAVTKYPRDYIDACRARVKSEVKAYRTLAKQAKGAGAKPLDAAVAAFEPLFFNNMVLALEASFVHRLRNVEGKDGNALNEVRVIANSILENNGVMAADKQIKLDPAKSVLKYAVGDAIKVSEAGFARLSDAFFDEMDRKYS